MQKETQSLKVNTKSNEYTHKHIHTHTHTKILNASRLTKVIEISNECGSIEKIDCGFDTIKITFTKPLNAFLEVLVDTSKSLVVDANVSDGN